MTSAEPMRQEGLKQGLFGEDMMGAGGISAEGMAGARGKKATEKSMFKEGEFAS